MTKDELHTKVLTYMDDAKKELLETQKLEPFVVVLHEKKGDERMPDPVTPMSKKLVKAMIANAAGLVSIRDINLTGQPRWGALHVIGRTHGGPMLTYLQMYDRHTGSIRFTGDLIDI